MVGDNDGAVVEVGAVEIEVVAVQGIDGGRRVPKRQGSSAEEGAEVPLVDHARGGSLVQGAFSWAWDKGGAGGVRR